MSGDRQAPRRVSGDLPAPVPVPNPDTAAFWAATAEGRLMLARCPGCGRAVWYPRRRCPFCHHDGTALVEAAGTGTVYSRTITRRGMGAFRDAAPYVLAYVELDEGPRMLTNVIGGDPETVAIGDRVRVVLVPTDGDGALPRFERTDP